MERANLKPTTAFDSLADQFSRNRDWQTDTTPQSIECLARSMMEHWNNIRKGNEPMYSIEDFRSLAEQAYRPSLVDKLYANVAKKQRAPRKAKKFASETEEEYEVGAILARRLKKSLGGAQPSMGPESYEYLIKWTDYDTTSWQPYEDLHNCSELLREFLGSSF